MRTFTIPAAKPGGQAGVFVLVPVLVFVMALLAGCDGLGSSPDAPVTVVEAYLIAGTPLGEIRLSETASVNTVYDVTDLAISDAQVRVERLASDGSVAESYPYAWRATRGAYSMLAAPTVAGGVTYRLVAELSNGETVTAETTVPGEFEIRNTTNTVVQYQSPDQFEVEVTRSDVGDRQAYFVFSVASLAPNRDNLTPLYAEFLDDDDDLSEVAVTESPPINELNYELTEAGTLSIKLPWLAVAFYGENAVIANSIDDNLYDFVRSQQVQQGGSTFSPGEIPNIIDHISGGTGVFGSLSRVSTTIEVLR